MGKTGVLRWMLAGAVMSWASTTSMSSIFDKAGFNLSYVRVASASSTTALPLAPPSGTQISALTWNIRIDSLESHARAAMAAAVAISPRPQIIAIQEAWSALLPAYIDELQKRTGQTWAGVFQQQCPPGAWNGSTCTQSSNEGVVILSAFPVVNNSGIYLPDADCWSSARSALRAAVNVNGTVVQVFNSHLQTGACSNSAAQRYSSMSRIKSWAAGYSSPQIVAGDFNADPDQIDTTSGMRPSFVETWALVGSGSRFTALSPNWTMKLDYWFTDAGLTAQPLSAEVVGSTGSISDHRPVRTTFLIAGQARPDAPGSLRFVAR